MPAFLVPMLINFAVAATMMVIGIMLAPQPKAASSTHTKMENPTASGGRTMMKIFGTVIIKSPNILWYGEKKTVKREIKA